MGLSPWSHVMFVCKPEPGNEIFPAAIAQASLFRDLSGAELGSLRSGCTIRVLSPRTILFKQADTPTHLHLIVSGLIKITQISPTGSQLALAYCGPRDALGCHALFGAKPQPATATTVTQCTVASWSAAHIDAFSRRDPTILRNAMSLVCQQGEDLLERVRELATESVEQRIARALGRVAMKMRCDPSAAINALPLSRQDVAELTGATLFTASRIMTAWEEQGIVRSWRGHVQIVDQTALAEIANGRTAGRRTKTR